MQIVNPVHEIDLIERLTRGFDRSPIQLNRRQESDAEIMLLPGAPGCLLAVTTDSLSEEIAAGLYDDPYLVGWMSVMVNMSDLAAVGASPLGLLVSEILPDDLDEQAIQRLQQGIRDGCEACRTHVIGGDTSSGEQLVLTGAALGVCRDGAYLSRIGCKPGDLLYSTGLLGCGNAFALRRFSHAVMPDLFPPDRRRRGVGQPAPRASDPCVRYRPLARLREGESLRGVATACMDTSDGVVATLDQLMRLNRAGFKLTSQWEALLDPAARAEFEAHGLPAWAALAGPHGEFELLFTVSPGDRNVLMEASSRAGWKPLQLGAVVSGNEMVLPLRDRDIALDTAYLRNLPSRCGTDPRAYVRALLAFDRKIQKGVHATVHG